MSLAVPPGSRQSSVSPGRKRTESLAQQQQWPRNPGDAAWRKDHLPLLFFFFGFSLAGAN
jgi:hypothetical protein